MPPINPAGPLHLLVIPGVDPNAPINAQIDQIDQNITFMLQDIDANFAKIHHTITEKIIPALKRFDRDTQPVKEASKFWRSFFEAAAQIQVAPGDTSTTGPSDSYAENEVGQDTMSGPSAAVEGSFGPSVSSTPLPANALSAQHISSMPSDESSKVPAPTREEQSWAASVESPFAKLNRQLRDDMKLDGMDRQMKQFQPPLAPGISSIISSSSVAPDDSPFHLNYPPSSSIASSSMATIQPTASPAVTSTNGANRNLFAPPTPAPAPAIRTTVLDKGKQRAHDIRDPEPPLPAQRAPAPLLKNVLRNNAIAGQRTPRARYNPFDPTRATPGQSKKWNGIADLRVASPVKAKAFKTPNRGPEMNVTFDESSSDDELPPGMSPPVTMNFTLPAKKLLRTPAKEVARMAVEGMMKGVGGDTPSPEVEKDGYGWDDPGGRMAHLTPLRRQKGRTPAKQARRPIDDVDEADSSLMESFTAPDSPQGTKAADNIGRYETPGKDIDALLDLKPERGLVDDDDDRSGEYQDDDSSFEDYGSPPTQVHSYHGAVDARGVDDSFDSSEGDSFSSVGSAPPGVVAQGILPHGRAITVDDPISDSDEEEEQQGERYLTESDRGGRQEDTGTVFGAVPVRPATHRRPTDFELLGRDRDEMTVHGGHVDHAQLGESPTPWPRER